jgi:hypothetical protein
MDRESGNQQESEEEGAKFIRAELDVAFNFVGLAQNSLAAGEREEAERACLLAMNAHEAILKFLPKAVFAEGEKLRITARIEELVSILGRLQTRLAGQRAHPTSDTPD